MAGIKVTYAKCFRCNHKLTTERAKRDGYGWRCRARLLDAAKKVSRIYSRAQVKKAATALRTGCVAHYCADAYRVVSSNGEDVYWTTPYSCTCPSRVRCYHQCAVMIMELTPLSTHRHT